MLISSCYGSILISWKFDFTWIKRLDEKRMQRVGYELGTFWLTDQRPRGHGHGEFFHPLAIFDKVIQLLLHSKAAKAEPYLIGGYHIEWLELTYYIETLVYSSASPCSAPS